MEMERNYQENPLRLSNEKAMTGIFRIFLLMMIRKVITIK